MAPELFFSLADSVPRRCFPSPAGSPARAGVLCVLFKSAGGGQEPLRGADSLFRFRPITPCLGCPLCPRPRSTRVS